MHVLIGKNLQGVQVSTNKLEVRLQTTSGDYFLRGELSPIVTFCPTLSGPATIESVFLSDVGSESIIDLNTDQGSLTIKFQRPVEGTFLAVFDDSEARYT